MINQTSSTFDKEIIGNLSSAKNRSGNTLGKIVGLRAGSFNEGASANAKEQIGVSIRLKDPNYFGSPGSVDKKYGLQIEAIEGGSTDNFSIHTEVGKVSLGDVLELRTLKKGNITLSDYMADNSFGNNLVSDDNGEVKIQRGEYKSIRTGVLVTQTDYTIIVNGNFTMPAASEMANRVLVLCKDNNATDRTITGTFEEASGSSNNIILNRDVNQRCYTVYRSDLVGDQQKLKKTKRFTKMKRFFI